METDSYTAGGQLRRGVGSGGTEEKGLMDMDNSVVIAGGGIRGLNGNKNTIKKFFYKRNNDAWDLHQNNTRGEGQRINKTGHKLVMTESGERFLGARYFLCPTLKCFKFSIVKELLF